jgi:DNA-binding transcriptional LysR family regulator
LSRRLGAQLVKRTTRALTLTAQGRQFLEQVAPALGALREANETLGARRPARGTVRVSASIDLGRTLVAAWSADFAREHPALVLELNVTAGWLTFDAKAWTWRSDWDRCRRSV